MALAALLIYAFGLALTFGVRTFLHRRRTGDSGLRLQAGPAGSVAWWAKLSFLAALVLNAAGPVAALAGMPNLPPLDHPAVAAAGLVITVAGAAATLGAQSAMGASWRVGVDPGERTALVTGGMFALVRNPIFTAMAASILGLTLMVPNPLALLGLATTLASIQLQVRAVEEPYLLAVHGAAYRAYAARTGRFLPGVGRLAGDDGRTPERTA